jgi:hypothetical protein
MLAVWKTPMIRTALSFTLLFGGLLLASKWLHQSTRTEPVNTATESPPTRPSTPNAAKPIPLASAPAIAIINDRDVRLVGFDEVPSRGLENFHHDKAVKGRIEDEETTEETLNKSDENIAPVVPAQEPEIAMTQELLDLRSKLRECLAYYYFRPENVAIRSPWGAMHAMIAYGVDTELIAGDKRVNAIGYLCYNGVCNGQQLLPMASSMPASDPACKATPASSSPCSPSRA